MVNAWLIVRKNNWTMNMLNSNKICILLVIHAWSLDNILSSFKHEVWVSMVIFTCHICLCWSGLICRKESVTRKVTVRLNTHWDENDQWGHVGTCQLVTLLGTTKEIYCANHCRKNLTSWVDCRSSLVPVTPKLEPCYHMSLPQVGYGSVSC